LARGGTNYIENILPACRRCNTRKRLLTEEEFRARLAAEGPGRGSFPATPDGASAGDPPAE
jgi:hypothetical protein